MLQLNQETVAQLVRWASKHPTIEVTGIVARSRGHERVLPMRNTAAQPDRYYAWDAAEMRDQYSDMDLNGEEPVAFYHSHPNGRSAPSEADMEGALNPGMHYVIVYPEAHELTSGMSDIPLRIYKVWSISAWECIDHGILVGAELVVVP
jgi:proteasome lid subunit RPN8/RPN11